MPSILPKCFVIMPFSRKSGNFQVEGKSTTVEIDFNAVYDEIIEPAIKEMAWEPVRADKIIGVQTTLKSMFGELLSAPFAIADCSFLNANVFYELGARHAVRPALTIAIAHEGTPIPYDIQTVPFRFFYKVGPDRRPVNSDKQVSKLVEHLKNCFRGDFLVDSPIYEANERPDSSKAIADYYTIEYPVLDSDGFAIGLKTGDLRNIYGVDAWVNTENNHMQMARPIERAISATIRYYGSRKNEGGRPIYDHIEKQLRSKTENVVPVELGKVFDTGPGTLGKSNGVKRIFHVATVEAQYTKGFTAGSELTQYVQNAVAAVEEFNAVSWRTKLETVLIPLFGTGQAGQNVEDAVDLLVSGALRAVKQIQKINRKTRLRKIYFLAYDERARDALNRSLMKWQRSSEFPKGALGSRLIK